MEPQASDAVPRRRNWSSASKRLAIGLLVGTAITAVPWLVSKLDYEGLWPINFLLLPGTIVGMIGSGGNVHLISLYVLNTSNVIAYALLTYWLLSRKRNHP
jgi:hypothetical protein